MHKSGFVNIIGNPNVGKSTLMNALVGERLSIITSKAQTTRHRIMGIVSGDDFQIVYSDTPGILKPAYKLQESMMKFVTGAITDADVILYVTDTVEQSDRSAGIVEKIRQSGIPTVVVINKIDLSSPEALEALVAKWNEELPGARIVPVSAREKFNIEGLFDTILGLLPEGPAFYPKDTLTDKTLRFFASEIIREKILRFYDKEIPYCCEIEIESYREEPEIDRIAATIYVARESQKGIIIGHKGEKLKRVGQTAREDMEQFLGKKVFLQLFVKVSEDWRNNDRLLRRFGYELEYLAAIRGNGLQLHSDLKGEHCLKVAAFTAEEFQGKADVIFVCVKGYSVDSITELIKRASHERTVVIPILNVYGTGPRIQRLVPGVTVLDGCIYIVGFVSGRGEITQMGKIFRLVYGAHRGTIVSRETLEAVQRDLQESGIKAEISDDINRDTFVKWSFISAMAVTGAYYDVPMGEVQKPGKVRDTFIGLSQESAALGRKLGIEFKEDIVQYNLKVIDKLAPESTASMQKDMAKGHQSEVQGLLFDMITAAEEQGIEVPTYRMVAKKFK